MRGGNPVISPRVRYDRFTNRWFITAMTIENNNNNNKVLLAMSNTGAITPDTVWSFFSFIPGNFVAFPTLGVDINALYVGGSFFSSSTGIDIPSKLVVINKAKLIQGILYMTKFSNIDEVECAQGADNYDSNATLGYMIGMSEFDFSHLNLRTISNPGSSNPSNPPKISNFISIPITTVIQPILINHKGNNSQATGKLNFFDNRLMNAVIRNNRLWTVQTIGLNNTGTSTGTITRNGLRWYRIDLTNFNTIVQRPLYSTLFTRSSSNDFNQLNYFTSSINISGQGHLLFGCSTAGTNAYINALAAEKLLSDPVNTFRLMPYTVSTTAYNPNVMSVTGRPWGSYSYSSVDPCDDMTMWTIQEYCNKANVAGLRIVKILAPFPAQPISMSPTTIPAGNNNVLITITGQQIDGSGFFDSGPGFNCRLRATVTGGVVVKNVVYNNPRIIDLVLDTTGVVPGSYNLTVINPDGQSRVGVGLIRVV